MIYGTHLNKPNYPFSSSAEKFPKDMFYYVDCRPYLLKGKTAFSLTVEIVLPIILLS